ncbi:MAG: DUF5676 family membrane protein [Ardenticatenaceae bacterium]|nr:DUF5676 family membrane protein [Ardenticatenaceae bacterium]HBY96735.1 hypothetical protein [Chloroflexota bacterium]
MRGLRITTVGWSLSVLLLVTYVLCVLWDLLFPGWAMYRVWQVLFPGFGWSLGGFLIGLVETVVYGFYAAVVFVPVYNYLHRREMAADLAEEQQRISVAHR